MGTLDRGTKHRGNKALDRGERKGDEDGTEKT
jgi:hypothetical protein